MQCRITSNMVMPIKTFKLHEKFAHTHSYSNSTKFRFSINRTFNQDLHTYCIRTTSNTVIPRKNFQVSCIVCTHTHTHTLIFTLPTKFRYSSKKFRSIMLNNIALVICQVTLTQVGTSSTTYKQLSNSTCLSYMKQHTRINTPTNFRFSFKLDLNYNLYINMTAFKIMQN